MLNSPFKPWPNFTDEEAEAVSRVLLSNKVNYWTGTQCKEFEKEFAIFSGTDHAISVANGTLALDLALHGLGVGSHNGGHAEDEVIVTSRSFVASASCIVNAGAKVVFSDVDRDTQNISGDSVAAQLTENTKAVICVHLAGWACDMDEIRETIKGRDIKLIEDCAQAHGAKYKGKPVGSLGDVAAWSFCQDKIMTTGGEGGMVTCKDRALWSRMWSFKDHGKSFDAVFNRQHPAGFRWLHESIGTNWRMTEMQAAIGRIQLKRMPQWHKARVQNAKDLMSVLAPYAGENGFLRFLPHDKAGSEHAWYRFFAFVRRDKLPDGETRDSIIDKIQSQGLPCMQGTCSEMYLEKAFDGSSSRPIERLLIAKELGENSLMFLTHPGVHKVEISLTK